MPGGVGRGPGRENNWGGGVPTPATKGGVATPPTDFRGLRRASQESLAGTVHGRGGGYPSGAERVRGVGVGADGGGVGTPH